jgi:uncharacterized protein YkwD
LFCKHIAPQQRHPLPVHLTPHACAACAAVGADNNMELRSAVLPAVAPTQPRGSPQTTQSSAQRAAIIAQNTTQNTTTIPRLYLQMLNSHNNFRMLHGVGNLTWDPELAAVARRWARACKFKHSPPWMLLWMLMARTCMQERLAA